MRYRQPMKKGGKRDRIFDLTRVYLACFLIAASCEMIGVKIDVNLEAKYWSEVK